MNNTNDLFRKAIEEYRNFGVITPDTEKKLLEGNTDPDARVKLWRRVASLVLCQLFKGTTCNIVVPSFFTKTLYFCQILWYNNNC